MLFDHHFIGMHWIWWVIIIVIILLVVFDVIPYRPKTDTTESPLDILT